MSKQILTYKKGQQKATLLKSRNSNSYSLFLQKCIPGRITTRLFILVSVILFHTKHVFTQKLYLSEGIECNLRTDDFVVVGPYKDFTAIYNNRGSDYLLHMYSAKMVLEKTISMDFLPAQCRNVKVHSNYDNIIVIYEVKENKKQQVFASKLNKDYTWTVPILLDAKPVNVIRDYDAYKWTFSEDRSKILLYTSYFSSGDYYVHSIVIDDQLHTINKISQSLTDKEYVLTAKAAVSNKGVPYLCATDKVNNRGNAEELKLLTISEDKDHFFVLPLSLQKHNINDAQIMIDNKNSNIYIVSFFADGKYSNPRGFCVAVFNESTSSFTNIQFIPVAMQMSAGKSDLRDVRIKNLYVKNNGNIIVTCEKYYQNTRNINSVNPIVAGPFMTTMTDNSRIVNEFYYDEIFIFDIKPNGSLTWSQTVLKEQMTVDDGGIFSSFITLQYPKGLIMFFNDLSTRSIRLLANYINNDGVSSLKEIQTYDALENKNLMVRSGVQVSKTAMVIPCISKNQLSFLKLVY